MQSQNIAYKERVLEVHNAPTCTPAKFHTLTLKDCPILHRSSRCDVSQCSLGQAAILVDTFLDPPVFKQTPRQGPLQKNFAVFTSFTTKKEKF